MTRNPVIPPIPKKRKQAHQSMTEMFSKCGMQVYFRYVANIRRPPNAFLLCGKATDTAVNANLDSKIVTGEMMKRGDVLDLAAATLDKEQEKDPIEVDKNDEDERGKSVKQLVSDARDKTVRLVGVHYDRVAPKIVPFRTARKFSVNMDKFLRMRAKQLHEAADEASSDWRRKVLDRQGASLNVAARAGLDFVGEQDIVEGFALDANGDKLNTDLPFYIRDTKTSRKTPASSIADESDQLTAYATASLVIDGKLPSKVALDYLIDLKRGVQYTQFSSERNEADVDVFLNRFATATIAMEQGVFVPTQQTAWWCSAKWCAYTEICPYFKQEKRPTSSSLDEMSGIADDRKPKLIQIEGIK